MIDFNKITLAEFTDLAKEFPLDQMIIEMGLTPAQAYHKFKKEFNKKNNENKKS